MSFQIELVADDDARLRQVVDLWGRNRKTLGHFPEGAFQATAASGCLIGAFLPDGSLVGYLAFRLQRRLNSAAIVHLCVASDFRGHRVSDDLFAFLKNAALDLRLDSIRLKCRRDYRAHALWQRLGFVARSDAQGRGEKKNDLTIWVYRFPNPDLFSAVHENDESKLKAVIDANVLFDLFGLAGGCSDESEVLLEPWVEDAVELCVVDEIHNEIDRGKTKEHRDHYHRKAASFRELHTSVELVREKLTVVRKLLGAQGSTDRDKSDRLQLAKTAAAAAHVFLTRDQELLDAATDIELHLGVRVQRPVELACTLNETDRAQAYQPVRLAGTAIQMKPLAIAELDSIARTFQADSNGETLVQFLAKARNSLSHVRAANPCVTVLVRGEHAEALALYSYVDDSQSASTEVTLLRVAETSLDRTLLRHVLLALVRRSATSSHRVLQVSDAFGGSLLSEALRELHFFETPRGWVRPTVSFLGPAKAFVELEHTIAPFNRDERCSLPKHVFSRSSPTEIEERFWPAKITGAGIPTFLIPIRPVWAAQLFDVRLADMELFGAFARLALNRDNVYYRSARRDGLCAPARILWYVSSEKNVAGTKAVRACSRLVAVDVDSAKKLYQRYRRLGIYEWKDVLKTARGDAFANVMALQFSDTETFSEDVPFASLREIGIRSNIQSPTLISEEQFVSIYKRGLKHPS